MCKALVCVLGFTNWVAEYIDFLLRIVLGAVFINHGYSKFINLDETTQFFNFIGLDFWEHIALLATYGEMIGGALIILGLFTRVAAVNCVVIMLTALYYAHWGQELKTLEFQFLLLASSAFLLFSGSGRVSVDSMIFGSKED